MKRIFNGVEVPEWFIPQRPPHSGIRPEKYIRQYSRFGMIIEEDDSCTLSDLIMYSQKNDIPFDRIEIFSHTNGEKSWVEANPFHIVDNPNYNEEMKDFLEKEEMVKVWNEVTQKLKNGNNT